MMKSLEGVKQRYNQFSENHPRTAMLGEKALLLGTRYALDVASDKTGLPLNEGATGVLERTGHSTEWLTAQKKKLAIEGIHAAVHAGPDTTLPRFVGALNDDRIKGLLTHAVNGSIRVAERVTNKQTY